VETREVTEAGQPSAPGCVPEIRHQRDQPRLRLGRCRDRRPGV